MKEYNNEPGFELMPAPWFYEGKILKHGNRRHVVSVQIGKGCFYDLVVNCSNLRKDGENIYIKSSKLKEPRRLAFRGRVGKGTAK